jgi:arylsulfatase A-like enzyme
MTHVIRLILSVSFLAASATSVQAGPPNFVIILIDDLGYGDVGCYGSKVNETPNIDRLAAEGNRFTDFHSNGPMCSATRAALLTGCYQQRFGKRFDSALGPSSRPDNGLPLKAVTIAEVLKQAGYATGIFGKWHVGYKAPFLPTYQGFDEFVGLVSGDGDHHTQIDRLGNEDWWKNDKIRMEEGYTAELLTWHSIDFIRRHKEEPFFLYVPHLAIHFPWQGPNDPPHRVKGTDYTSDKWGIVPDRNNVALHVKAMIEAVDKSVGEIVSAIDKHGLTDNTLVIFASDNGGYTHYKESHFNISNNGPLKGQKGGVEEGGHRVPCIARWPGKIKPGQAVGDTVMTMDFYPTLAGLAEAQLSKGQKLDGIDLAPLLFRGESLPERMVFWRRAHRRAARSGPWKLNLSDDEELLLYNLQADVGETKNVADEHPQLVKQLRSAWFIWERDVNAGFAR